MARDILIQPSVGCNVGPWIGRIPTRLSLWASDLLQAMRHGGLDTYDPQVEIPCYLKKFPDTRPAGVLNRAEAAVSRTMLFAPVKG
jgi:hypothetical protein